MFLNNSVSRGVRIPPPDFVTRSEVFLKASTAVIILFYSTLWSIKLSFLFFFRRLYINVSGGWMRFWWAIMVITIASWAVCIGNIDYKCLVRPLEEIALNCNTDDALRYQKITLILNCVLDTFTDVLSKFMSLPLLLPQSFNLFFSNMHPYNHAMEGQNQYSKEVGTRRCVLGNSHHHYFRYYTGVPHCF
jgi:hypothetical protein